MYCGGATAIGAQCGARQRPRHALPRRILRLTSFRRLSLNFSMRLLQLLCASSVAAYHTVPPHVASKHVDIVTRARADVARGIFGRQIGEHGERLKRMESDRFERWTAAGLNSPLTLRAARAAARLENLKTGSQWAVVRVADAKQWAHMGLVYKMKLDLCKQSDAGEDCVHGRLRAHGMMTADVTVLWQSWAKPPYALHGFSVSKGEHFAHPLPKRGHYAAAPKRAPVAVPHAQKITAHDREVARTAYIKKLQGVLKLYSHYKSNPKYTKLAARLESLCHADTLGTCHIFGCSSWRNAKCVHGKCACELGTCAKQDKSNGGFTCAKDGW